MFHRASFPFVLAVFIAACSSDEKAAGPGDGGDMGGASNGGGSGNGGSSNGGSKGSGATSGGGTQAAGGKGSGGTNVGGLKPVEPNQFPPPDPNAVVIPNIDSAVINIEKVAGAKDYRAFVVKDGVEVLTDDQGHEVVKNATIFCAGFRQIVGPKLPEPEPATKIEVTDLHEKATYVVEAIDTACPFSGLFGARDTQFTVLDPMTTPPYDQSIVRPVPVLSEAKIRERFGNMIVNGQLPGNPKGQPAEPNTPKVLKRWTVEVSPLTEEEANKRKTSTFFSDFSDEDEPVMVPGGTNGDGTFHAPEGRGYSIAVYQNKNFNFYATNAELIDKNHVFFDRGQMHMLLADASQSPMSTILAIPRKTAHFTDNGYVHATFETQANSSARRYFWFSMCGAEEAGQTLAGDGLLKEYMALTSGFFNRDGANPSVAGWNCFVLFPHDGIATAVPPPSGKLAESSVIALIHKSGAPALQSAVNVSPQQLNDGYPPAWYRLQKGSEVTTTGILDDVLNMTPRTHFDVYISRSRLVVYVNGQQRICNDFGPQRLTMAEAAVGFNVALYHSSAEHSEYTVSFSDHSGQLQYLNNTIFAEQHSYDNVGFEEGVGLPSSYTDADCHTYRP